MSYEDKKEERFPVIIRSKCARNFDFELFGVICTQYDPQKGPQIGQMGQDDKLNVKQTIEYTPPED